MARQKNEAAALMQMKSPIFSEIERAVAAVEKEMAVDFYVCGGTVRDLFLNRTPADLDIALPLSAVQASRFLIEKLGGGALVVLGTEDEEAARVVWHGRSVDFSCFRKGARDITADLCLRDFTINAMALPYSGWLKNDVSLLIDPLNGREDLQKKVLHCCKGAFVDDPLRMLRGYRLRAELGFALTEDTAADIRACRNMLSRCAAERIQYELDRIMSTESAALVIQEMAETGLLWQIFPELKDGVGVEQPGFHHEDVFHHNLLALTCLEKVLAKPGVFFQERTGEIEDYLGDQKKRKILRWSALFHDLGKPATASSGTMKSERVTFYGHDSVGRQIFSAIAERLRWNKNETAAVARLIEMHMHPFHLCNARGEKGLSRKACLRICKKAGEDMPGLFVLAMADSLASQGELKPEGMEEKVAALYEEIETTNETIIRPALQGERLITGNDLISHFNLTPGPLFSKILQDLELARVEEHVRTREEAFSWLSDYLQKGCLNHP